MLSPGFAAFKDQSRISSGIDGPQINGNGIDGKQPPKAPNPLLPDDLVPTSPDKRYEAPPKKVPETGKELPLEPTNSYDINDIPILVPLALTLGIAKRALDAFADVGTRYDDKGLYDYPSLEDYVKKTTPGKQLEADVKKYGFKNIVDWNTAIMNVSFAYGALLQNQEEDIRRQIEAVKEDKSLSAEKKQQVVASLKALIPSKENIKVIQELNKLPAYQEKLNLLDAFE